MNFKKLIRTYENPECYKYVPPSMQREGGQGVRSNQPKPD
jgi:hypothetical protein